ncbi:MAG: TonB family protein [Deltaproteobacteria bacterium]|nr:TonB family protein [Deltaproteobacteria bacterium]
MSRRSCFASLPFFGLIFLLCPTTQAADSNPAITHGGLMQARIGQRKVVLPLQKTEVVAKIAGVVADVRVKQRFFNSDKKSIEAVYVFPLPHRAAVHGMTITLGKRTIHAVIKTRKKAKAAYKRAKAAGRRAALLEQQRPNIFTQHVTNIMPGETVVVTLRYLETLTPEDGTYAFVFPLVVGPRYLKRNTRRSPKPSPISPPALKKGQRPGHDVDIEVHVAGGPSKITAPSHAIKLRRAGSTALVSLAPHDRIPNKDFVLRYQLAGSKPRVTALSHWGKQGGHLLLMVQPPKTLNKASIPPREIIFVVDNSGSMWGFPLQQAQALMKKMLGALRPEDRFQIIRFAGDSDRFRPASVPANYQNLAAGLAYLENMRSGGGTKFLPALKMAFSTPKPPGRARTILFITDGYIGYERDVLRMIEKQGKGSTVFALGIGSSVNRWLIDSMARVGGGTSFFLLHQQKPEEVAKRIAATLSRPAITDLTVNWRGLPVKEVTPRRLSDLYLDKPVLLLARYHRAATGSVTLRGRQGRKNFAVTIPLKLTTNTKQAQHGAVPRLWAREKIAELMDRWTLHSDHKTQAEKRITKIALRYTLMSRFTSFVAVDSQVVNAKGKTTTHAVPLPLPVGVSRYALPVAGRAGVLGMLKGNQVGSSYGYAGLGLRRTIGRGGRLSRRGGRVTLPSRATRVYGSLDRSVIQRIIRRHLKVLQYCYEKQLLHKPTLKGRVVVEFVIGPAGRVLKAKVMNSTLNDKKVQACILRAIRHWRFPKRPGDGIVKVRYPFVFRSK